MKTIKEFRNELETLRKEIFRQGTNVDVLLLASWLDRMVIALEEVSPTLDIMAEELDVLAEKSRKETKKPEAPKTEKKKVPPKKLLKKVSPKAKKKPTRKLSKKVSSKKKIKKKRR